MPLGLVLVSRIVWMWERHVSAGRITGILNDAYGTGLRRTAVQNALAAAVAIAARFGLHATGRTFATKLANAAPFLFTFVNYLVVDPTNNESERMLRKMVVARKIRFRVASMEGARMFSNMMTCVLTWRKWNFNVSDILLKILSGT